MTEQKSPFTARDVDKEKIRTLATGESDAIPWRELEYEEWLAIQHFWMRERLGLEDGDPLAVALEALDRIARLPINGSGNNAYWVSRIALEKTGGWARRNDNE